MQKRIGIIIGKPYHTINRPHLQGILQECYRLGLSAYVFSINEEFYDDVILKQERNILHAIEQSGLDGMIYLPYSLTRDETQPAVTEFLRTYWKKPIVMIGAEAAPFPNVWFDEARQFEALVTHLIAEHGCRDILCLTGFEHERPAENRADGWRRALRKAELPAPEDRLVYGDFWIDAPKKLAAELTDGTRTMPEAIVCANDRMALSLCDALAQRGIRVPEDVLVTGFDGIAEANLHIPSLTTCVPAWEELGKSAVQRLFAAMTGTVAEEKQVDDCQLILGESCGHHRTENRSIRLDYETLESRYLDTSITSLLLSDGSISSFFQSVYYSAFFFWGSNHAESGTFCLCLCEDWNKAEFSQDMETYRTGGYSPQMLVADPEDPSHVFPLTRMVPEQMDSDVPSATFFLPIYFRDRCFGYTLMRLDGIADSYDIYYLRFCREVGSALAFLCLQNDYRSLAFRSYVRGTRDDLTGLYLFERSRQMWEGCISTAQLYGETLYVLAFYISGLQQVEDVESRIERDKVVLAFSDILIRSCRGRDLVFLTQEGAFLIIGSQLPPVSRPEQIRTQITEQFQRSEMQTEHYYLSLSSDCLLFDTAIPLEVQQAADSIIQLVEELRQAEPPTFQTKQHYQRLRELRREIYTDPEREWSVAFCAEEMCISQSYFVKLYQNAFGCSCLQDIRHSKLAYAKKLLLQTDLILEEIARKCGYDYTHFMRLFKKEVGMTPTAYRKGESR